MMLTMFNKLHVDRVFEKALANRNIEALRSRTSPTILNNLLWACVAEDKETYYVCLLYTSIQYDLCWWQG